jgi:uncharacterized protein YbjT (DUF2867 family)
MRILVTGASGFVGSSLVPRLRAHGHTVRALGRDPERVRAALERGARDGADIYDRDDSAAAGGESGAAGVELVRADALTGAGLERALADVQVAYYLIHSMERPSRDERHAPANGQADVRSFAERDRLAAENFGAAAERAGVQRIVYLGGLTGRDASTDDSADERGPGRYEHERDTNPEVSRHLASREQVEHVLLDAVSDSLALRASIVIGARSRSFRLLVHLLERIPLLALPAWHAFRTQPIDERDVIEMLAACATARLERRTLDVGGPEPLTYGEMLRRIADVMLINRPTVSLGVKLTGVTARVAAAIAGEDPELVVALMEGLQGDLLPADDRAAELLGVRLHTFDAAVEHALAEWIQSERLAAR